MQIFGGHGLAKEYRVSWLKSYADQFFTGEGSAPPRANRGAACGARKRLRLSP